MAARPHSSPARATAWRAALAAPPRRSSGARGASAVRAAYDQPGERAFAARVARSLATHGVDARELADSTLDLLRRAGVSTSALLEEAGASASSATSSSSASDDPDAAFAEWSQAFAAEVAPSLRAHGLEADALPGRSADILARAGYPEWVAWYQSPLPRYQRVDLDAAVEQFDDRAASVSNSSARSGGVDPFSDPFDAASFAAKPRVRGMTLLDSADSAFGTLQVLRVDDDPENPDDATFAGATILQREHTPDAVLSEYRPGSNAATGGVFDLFAMLPPLVRNQPPAYPIGVLGLGAGTCAREFAQFYPSDRRRVVGWEIDPAIVHLARSHFGMVRVSTSRRLVVRVGDGFEEIRRAFHEGRLLAGVVVDVFDEQSRVLPELTREETWWDIARARAGGARHREPEHGAGRGRGPRGGGDGGGARRRHVRGGEGHALEVRRARGAQRGRAHGRRAAGVEEARGAPAAAHEVRGGVVRGRGAEGEKEGVDSLLRRERGAGRREDDGRDGDSFFESE